MLYVLFLVLAILYNFWKFRKERLLFLESLTEASSANHQEMILGHHFHIFIFEVFFAIIVAHIISEGEFQLGLLGLGLLYVLLTGFFLLIYQYFLKYVEKATKLKLRKSFNQHIIREFRVGFALILLPILLYSIISYTFQDSAHEEWGSYWFLGILSNIIFVSILTIICTVIIMLRLIPNREISEPEYLELINKRLIQIGMPQMRVRWIETDIKNAFVVGISLLRFSNQTMFVGRNLRTTLDREEFDAVIAHELSHVANKHIHKRVIELLKNFLAILSGFLLIMFFIFFFSYLYYGEDLVLHTGKVVFIGLGAGMAWMFFNYAIFFDTMRSQEFEADAYAVLQMGVSYAAFKSALEKLTIPEEIPAYLQSKQNSSKKNRFIKWLSRLFSSHPSLKERLSLLEYKMAHGLPFNYYDSPAHKIRRFLGTFLQWKISLPLACSLAFGVTWSTLSIRDGKKLIGRIHRSSSEALRKDERILKSVNSKPLLVGRSLMYYLVQKKDPALIDYFLERGALKGRTLVYISELQDINMLKKYFTKYHKDLSRDEYFLILRKTAEINFTEGYRLLVQSSHFEALDPEYKADLTRLHQTTSKSRRPASVK